MANAQDKQGMFIDLGSFKKIDCKEILGVTTCQAKFSEGKFTLTKKELKKMCIG